MPADAELLSLFAVTAPGLEELCAAELRAMGIAGAVEPGGVAWDGTRAELYDANLRLRTASRVLVRVAEWKARTFFELERHARKVPWERFVRPGGAVRLRVTSRKSKLYHEGAIAERLLDAAARSVGGVGAAGVAKGSDEDDEEAAAGQLFVVRFAYDRCTVSADASGALLHLRGYRQAVAKAPLRETLAAAMLLGSGWDGAAPLLDPMCGSGTVAVEGALLARRIAPGLAAADRTPRRYAFQEWPGFDAGLWETVVERARGEILPAAPATIQASDRDAGAVEAARANAERAGVADDVSLEVRALSSVQPPEGPGWLVSNPPYGVRVGEAEGLRNLYAALGRLAHGRLPGWTVALLSADKRLEAQVRVRFREAVRTKNGGIPVRLVVGQVEE
jgi:putative N6-adenine-specific DNA methylase